MLIYSCYSKVCHLNVVNFDDFSKIECVVTTRQNLADDPIFIKYVENVTLWTYYCLLCRILSKISIGRVWPCVKGNKWHLRWVQWEFKFVQMKMKVEKMSLEKFVYLLKFSVSSTMIYRSRILGCIGSSRVQPTMCNKDSSSAWMSKCLRCYICLLCYGLHQFSKYRVGNAKCTIFSKINCYFFKLLHLSLHASYKNRIKLESLEKAWSFNQSKSMCYLKDRSGWQVRWPWQQPPIFSIEKSIIVRLEMIQTSFLASVIKDPFTNMQPIFMGEVLCVNSLVKEYFLARWKPQGKGR